MRRLIIAEIDLLSESVIEKDTGIVFETRAIQADAVFIQTIQKKSGWKFNWKREFKYFGHHIYKLILSVDETVLLGLISLEIMEDHVHVHLVESVPKDFGIQKNYLGIGGNLFAFACKKSFENGFVGNIAFISKTNLIQHYSLTLGAIHIGNSRMLIRENEAKILINKYYGSGKNY